jgi:hypothetical protein
VQKSKAKIKSTIKKVFKKFCIINTARIFFSFFLRYKERDTGPILFLFKKISFNVVIYYLFNYTLLLKRNIKNINKNY